MRRYAIASDSELGPLLEAPPPDSNPLAIRHLRHMYEAGGWVLLESAIADLPIDLRWLLESGAVDVDRLGALHRALGVVTAADLDAEVARQTVRRVPPLGEAVERAIADALPTLRASLPRIPLGRAMSIAQPALNRLRELASVEWVKPVGSLRRGLDFIGDIEIVAATTSPAAVLAAVDELPNSPRTLYKDSGRAYLLIDRVQVGVRCVDPAVSGAALLHLTGSHAHLHALRQIARERGCSLEPEGLIARDRPAATEASTEAAIYEALGLPFVAPELRSGGDEIAAAKDGRLPALVSRDDIRGDLHMHTDWSDGRDSIEAMVQAAIALEYEYAAITDHSPSSAAVRNLTLDGVAKQADEIARLRERYPQITILHGCEVDILQDGRLDFPDRVLERFDIVLASLHEGMGHSPERLLRRYQSAMRHPLVALITHPTNRLVPHRQGYDLDYDRLFAVAVESRTAVEIDGSPAHLDLCGPLARRAVEAGALLAIDSDSHRAEMLDRQMQFGVMIARSGWVERRHVLNTRSIGEVRELIAAKRGG